LSRPPLGDFQPMRGCGNDRPCSTGPLTTGWRQSLPSRPLPARLAPNDARIAHGHVRMLLEAGRPSLAAFERARTLAPADGDVLLGMYAAMLASRDGDRAIRELDALLAQNPGWIAGHNDLL